MRRTDKILYSLLLTVGAILPAFLTVANHMIYASRSLTILQLLSAIIYALMAFWLTIGLTGDGKYLTKGRWDSYSEERKKAFKEQAASIGRLMTLVLAIGAAVLESVLFLLPAYSWAIVLVTMIFTIIASVTGIRRISRKGKESSGYSLLKDDDRMMLNQWSFSSIFMLLVILPVVLFISGGIFGDLSVTIGDDMLSIDSPIRDWDIAYPDIDNCELKDGTFEVRRVSGLGNHRIIAGNMHNDEIGDCKGALYENTDACVLVRTNDGSYYVFNDTSVDGTKALYEELTTHLGQ